MVDFDQFGQSIKDAAASFAAGASQFGSEVGESVSNATGDVMRYKNFRDCGRDLFVSGAITSHGGNMSQSDGSSIWITRRDSMLGRLGSSDIVETTWEIGPCDQYCSRELVVHRAMYHGYYQRLAAQGAVHPEAGNTAAAVLDDGEKPKAAIIHAHTRHTIARSLRKDLLVPCDSEGLYTLGKDGIKVYAPAVAIESEEAANMLGQAVFDGVNIAVIKGHGPFAIASTVFEALRLVSVLEASCEILDILELHQ